MIQKLEQFRQEDIQRQNEVKEIHQVALADKQQRQTEIAERQQEVAQQREQNRAENAERRQYVWGDQAGVTPSAIAQPMNSQNSQQQHQESHDYQDQHSQQQHQESHDYQDQHSHQEHYDH